MNHLKTVMVLFTNKRKLNILRIPTVLKRIPIERE